MLRRRGVHDCTHHSWLSATTSAGANQMSSSTVGFRRSTCTLAVFAAVTLTACSENATSPLKAITPGSAALDQSPEFNDPSGHGHVFHTKQWFENAGNAHGHGPPGGGSSTGISYHGGPV